MARLVNSGRREPRGRYCPWPDLDSEISEGAISHDQGSIIGGGCDDQVEFTLNLILDGIERLPTAS